MQKYQGFDERQAVLALWYITNTSLVSYYKLIKCFNNAKTALLAEKSAWQQLNIHSAHIGRWGDFDDVSAFVALTQSQVSQGLYQLIYRDDKEYPASLQMIYDPPPVLFCRGNIARLQDRQIAIVGTREPSEYAQKITFDLAQYLVQAGFTITSGLAQGVDRQAHLGALTQSSELLGRTVGVMGTGIDVCYPRNHHALFAKIIADGGCLISELLPATAASKHTFPRRNRLVAGLSMATVVTEAAMQSGSLITARLSAEQGKQVFVVPGMINNPQAEGCHHLIREGATLIYHPDQILEDVASQNDDTLPTQFSNKQSVFNNVTPNKSSLNPQALQAVAVTDHQNDFSIIKPPTLAEHLQGVYGALSATPQDLDAIIGQTGMQAGELLAALLELQMLGLAVQQGGFYVKN